MSFYTGSQGRLFIDGSTTAAARVSNWSFQASQSTLETTSLGDWDRELIAGTRTLSGSARMFYFRYDSGGTIQSDVSPLLNNIIRTTNTESPTVRLKLFVADGTDAGLFLEFDALITSASMSCAVGEVLAADFTFESTGRAIEQRF